MITEVKRPLTPFTIEDRLARPSKDAIPYVVPFWFKAIDWICENLPRSKESMTVRLFVLVISTTVIR